MQFHTRRNIYRSKKQTRIKWGDRAAAKAVAEPEDTPEEEDGELVGPEGGEGISEFEDASKNAERVEALTTQLRGVSEVAKACT